MGLEQEVSKIPQPSASAAHESAVASHVLHEIVPKPGSLVHVMPFQD